MRKIVTALALVIIVLPSPIVMAHDVAKDKKANAPHPSPWDGTNAQVGYVVNRGNTNSSMMNLGLNLSYKKPRWQNQFQAQFQYGKQDHTANRQYTHLNDQVQWSLNDHKKLDNFIFTNGDSIITKFGPYSYQNVFAAGWGKRWVDTKHFTLSAQVGPGYRVTKVQDESDVESSFIGTVQSNISLILSSYGTLTQSIRFDLAKPYNYVQAVTAFTNKIVGHIAVQVSYTLTYYSQIPTSSANTKKMDTITNISLVYNF
ncbi:MAG: hypothetical protein COB66_05755 [Coxiella sp. (in: Bacteria)]|nr:MAG: hypothetical protein COB66_05755 [Coxiella sp. (in: g-proteobacteria)]